MKTTAASVAVLLFSFLILLLFSQIACAYSSDVSSCPLISNLEMSFPANATPEVGESTFNVSFRTNANSRYTYELFYSLDGQANISLPLTSTFIPVKAIRTYPNGTTETAVSQIFSYYLISSQIVFTELSSGTHNLAVYGIYHRLNNATDNWPELLLDQSNVNFTVTGSLEATMTETVLPIKQQIETPNDTVIVLASVLTIGFSVLVVFFFKKRAEH